MPTPSVKRQWQWQRPIQVNCVNGDFSQASTQASSGIFEVCRLPLGVFMPLLYWLKVDFGLKFLGNYIAARLKKTILQEMILNIG